MSCLWALELGSGALKTSHPFLLKKEGLNYSLAGGTKEVCKKGHPRSVSPKSFLAVPKRKRFRFPPSFPIGKVKLLVETFAGSPPRTRTANAKTCQFEKGKSQYLPSPHFPLKLSRMNNPPFFFETGIRREPLSPYSPTC